MKTIQLVEGHFTPEEAREVLLTLISSKANFHKIKNLSSEVRYSKPDPDSQKRLEELEDAKKQVIALVKKAAQTNGTLKIMSTIHLELEEAVPAEALYSRAHV